MNHIKVECLECNKDFIEKSIVLSARLTQRGHNIKNKDDLSKLIDKPYTKTLLRDLCHLPHPTIQKFGNITFAVIGCSRRFLAQITRHQTDVHFISTSLQYSTYDAKEEDFVIPKNILKSQIDKDTYIETCKEAANAYNKLCDVSNDEAGYVMPQALRHIILITANPYQWKHMIKQRICRRNTDETRYIMLLIWKYLYNILPEVFEDCIPCCLENDKSCGDPLYNLTPEQLLKLDYGDIYE